ncbi:ribosome-associated translation inhibitor RaiA [Alkalinema sp. FACHB-956]|uniref:ribosome hibernation-promoting factor, HPF/YfiA family n=1 Tax=Alkalinema sp. FACHB-956 TaxID=2692768 RepID=UPI0016864DB8|nr:ribosome-associated translation inhibitor RaiA [Alkalinema sp. FACHB-956]MBD2326441.1 ribosome-associated translation inhibitor RaiA [Alkalinema sp. FACHB-956]
MKLVIQGKNIDITDAIREYVHQKIEKAAAHFDHLLTEVDVDLSVERNPRITPRQTAEVTIFVNGSNVVRAQESSENLYASIDMVADKLSRQLRKYKEKRRDRNREPVKTSVALAEQPVVTDLKLDRAPALPSDVVRVKYFAMPPMTMEDALEQLENIDHDFYMFCNVETSEINVIYKRNHGGYGVIQPRKNNGHTHHLSNGHEKNGHTAVDEMRHVVAAMDG